MRHGLRIINERGEKRRSGRGDRARTCDLNVPNVARYQLRYTPMRLVYQMFFGSMQASVDV